MLVPFVELEVSSSDELSLYRTYLNTLPQNFHFAFAINLIVLFVDAQALAACDKI